MHSLKVIQFNSKAYECKPGSPHCKALCRNPKMTAWRKHETGMEKFPCPHGEDAVVRRKSVSATPEEVEERIAIPCDKRVDGKCTACKTCQGTPSCRQVAQWKSCPNGFWKAKSGI